MIIEWRAAPNWENEYVVSNQGNVKRIFKNQRVTVPVKSHLQNGYSFVTLHRRDELGKRIPEAVKTVCIHRLVAKAFIPGFKQGLQVNHKNGIKHDNRAENLEWVTASENIRHAINVLNANVGGRLTRKPRRA